MGAGGREWSVRRLKWGLLQYCKLQGFKEILCEAGLRRGPSVRLELQSGRWKLDSKEDFSVPRKGHGMGMSEAGRIWGSSPRKWSYYFFPTSLPPLSAEVHNLKVLKRTYLGREIHFSRVFLVRKFFLKSKLLLEFKLILKNLSNEV